MDARTAALCGRTGQRIRAERLRRGLSQADLAGLANIGSDQMSNIELGKVAMRLPTFARLVEALQVSADSLLPVDTPAGRGSCQGAFAEIVADCTPEEIESLLAVVKEIKRVLHQNRSRD